MYFPYALPCPTEGCENSRRADQDVCGGCAIRRANEQQREDAQWSLYANDGLRKLVEYLGRWALFEERHGPN